MLEKFKSTEEEQHPTHEHHMFDEMPIHKKVEKKYVDESSTPLIDEKLEEFAAVMNNNGSSHIIQVHIAATIASAEKNHYAIKDSVTNLKKYIFENYLDSEVELKVTDTKIHKLVEEAVEFVDATHVPARSQLLENVVADPRSFVIGPDPSYRRSTKFAEEGHSSTLDKAKQLKESNCSTQETHMCNEEWDKANFRPEIEKIVEIWKEYVRQYGVSFFCPEVLERALILSMEMRLVGLIIMKLLKKFFEKVEFLKDNFHIALNPTLFSEESPIYSGIPRCPRNGQLEMALVITETSYVQNGCLEVSQKLVTYESVNMDSTIWWIFFSSTIYEQADYLDVSLFAGDRNVVLWDLSNNFVLSNEVFGKSIAIASMHKLQELNNSAFISTLVASLTDEQVRQSELIKKTAESAIWEWPHTKSHSFRFVGNAKIKEWNLLVGLLKLACLLPCPLFDIEMQWKGSGAHVSQYCSVDQHLKQFPFGGELLTIVIKVLLVLGKNLIIRDFSEIPFNLGVVINSILHITLEDKGGFKGRYNWQYHGIGVRSCCQGSYYIDEFNCGAKHGFILYCFAHKCCIYKGSWQENCRQHYRRYTYRKDDTRYDERGSSNLNTPLSPLTDVVLRVVQAACSSLILSDHGWKILESNALEVVLDPEIIGSRLLVYQIDPEPSWRSRCPKLFFLRLPKMKMSSWGSLKQMILNFFLSISTVCSFSSSSYFMRHFMIPLIYLFGYHDLLIILKSCTSFKAVPYHFMIYMIHFEAPGVNRICWEYNVSRVILIFSAIFLVSITQESVTVKDIVNDESSKLHNCCLRPETSHRKDPTRKSQSSIIELSELGLKVVALVVALASVVALILKEMFFWYNKETAYMKSHCHILFNDAKLHVVAISIELVRLYDLTIRSCSYMLAEHIEIVLCIDASLSSSSITLNLAKKEDLLWKCFENTFSNLFFLEDKEVLNGGELIRFKMEEVEGTSEACTMGLHGYTVKLMKGAG